MSVLRIIGRGGGLGTTGYEIGGKGVDEGTRYGGEEEKGNPTKKYKVLGIYTSV